MREGAGGYVGVVFVHGFLSSPDTWDTVGALIAGDPELADVREFRFRYATPAVSISPLRRIPDLNDIGDALATYLRTELADCDRIVLVAHSQGGLVVQRFLARTLAAGRGLDLAAIRHVVMYACPSGGSELALLLRRAGGMLWRHPQERDLRPLTAAIVDAQRIVLRQVVHARGVAAHECQIPIVAYAGESDGVVTPASARGVFPDTGVLPGDHFTIVQPDTVRHPAYRALKSALVAARAAPPRPAADVGRSRSPVAVGPASPHPPTEPEPARDQAPRREDPAMTASPMTLADRTALVDALLAVPRMMEPAFRHALYLELPEAVAQQLMRDANARAEMFALLRTFDDFPHLRPWAALVGALVALYPEHPAITGLHDRLCELHRVA